MTIMTITPLTTKQQSIVEEFVYVTEIVASKYANKDFTRDELLSVAHLALVKLVSSYPEPFKYSLVWQACKMDVFDYMRNRACRAKHESEIKVVLATEENEGGGAYECPEPVSQDLDGYDLCLLKDTLKQLPTADRNFLQDYTGMSTQDLASKYSLSAHQLGKRVDSLYNRVKELLSE